METSTCVWRGRRCTWSHLPAFGVEGVALVALGGALGRRCSPLVARGAAPLCEAGVDIYLRLVWQVWHLETSSLPAFGVAGVAHWRGRRGNFVISYTIFLTPTHSHNFVCHTPSFTHHLTHTTLSHTIFLTHNFVTGHLSHNTIFHTPSHSHNFVTHHLYHTQLCHTLSFSRHLSHTTLSHTIFLTPSFTHHFVTHHLWHTIFHTQLCHTPSFTHNFVTHHISPHHFSHTALSHTPSFCVTHHLIFHIQLCHTHTTLSHTHNFVLLLDPPPPPLSFLPSPSPLQHMVLIIGRSCLVGLSGPLILVPGCWKCLIYHFGLIMLERWKASLNHVNKYVHIRIYSYIFGTCALIILKLPQMLRTEKCYKTLMLHVAFLAVEQFCRTMHSPVVPGVECRQALRNGLEEKSLQSRSLFRESVIRVQARAKRKIRRHWREPLFPVWISLPQNSVATLGLLTVGVKVRCSFKFGDPYSTKVPLWDVHVHFDCAGSHKPRVAEVSFEGISLSYVHFSWQALHFRDMLRCRVKRRFAWHVQDIGHLFIRAAGLALLK